MSALPRAQAEQRSRGEELFEQLREAYYSPALFFFVFLRVPYLYTWQRDFCARIETRLRAGEKHIKALARTNHGAGKDFLSAGLVLWWMYTREAASLDPRGLTLAPTWTGIKDLLWAEIGRLWNGSMMKDLNWGELLDTQLNLSTGSFARGMSSDRPGKLEGQHSPGAALRIVDEAKEIEAPWFEATRGLLNSPTSFDLWISTPSIEDGEFYKRDMKPDDSIVRTMVAVDDLIADYDDHGYPTLAGMRAWRDECLKDWGEESAAYRSRCQGEYITDAEGTLFPASWIERAFAIKFADEGEALEVVTGLDPAGSVDGDENGLATTAHMSGGRLSSRGLSSWHERDTMISKGKLIARANEQKSVPRVDSIGLGKGILDAARQDGLQVEEFRASDKPKDLKQFVNRKAEEAWAFRKKLEQKNVSLFGVPLAVRQKLKSQMSAMRYQIGATGQIKVVDPSDSPDLADALLISSAVKRINIVSIPRLRGM